jgi:hypothetical protein
MAKRAAARQIESSRSAARIVRNIDLDADRGEGERTPSNSPVDEKIPTGGARITSATDHLAPVESLCFCSTGETERGKPALIDLAVDRGEGEPMKNNSRLAGEFKELSNTVY